MSFIGGKRKKGRRKGMSETYTYNTKNRQLSQHLFMSLDTRITDLNNNVLVIGGAGAGKTYRFVKPQVLEPSPVA